MSIRLLIKESHKLKRKMRKKAVETINQDYFCSDQKCTCCNRLEVWQLENASSISADIDSVSIDIDDFKIIQLKLKLEMSMDVKEDICIIS
jgi:hypothetical protein